MARSRSVSRRKRNPSAYNKFVGVQMSKNGLNMKQAAAAWKSGSRSVGSSSRRVKRRSPKSRSPKTGSSSRKMKKRSRKSRSRKSSTPKKRRSRRSRC